jgi:hypothetical protein
MSAHRLHILILIVTRDLSFILLLSPLVGK